MSYASSCQDQVSSEGGCHYSRDSCRISHPLIHPVREATLCPLSTSWWPVAHSTCIGLVLPPLSLEGSLWQRPHGVCLPMLLRVCGSITHPENVHNIVDTCSCQNFKQSLIRQNFRRFSWFFLKFPQPHCSPHWVLSCIFWCHYNHFQWNCVSCECPYPSLFIFLLYGIWWLPINFKYCLKY